MKFNWWRLEVTIWRVRDIARNSGDTLDVVSRRAPLAGKRMVHHKGYFCVVWVLGMRCVVRGVGEEAIAHCVGLEMYIDGTRMTALAYFLSFCLKIIPAK